MESVGRLGPMWLRQGGRAAFRTREKKPKDLPLTGQH